MRRRRSGQALSLVGLVAVPVPFALLAVPIGLNIEGLLGVWATDWGFGVGAAIVGTWWMGAAHARSRQHGEPRPGFRLGVVAACLLALGFLLFAATVVPRVACEPPCPVDGAGPNGSSPTGPAGPSQCCFTAGPAGPPWFLEPLLASFYLDAAGGVLLVLAVRAAWKAAAGRGEDEPASPDLRSAK